MKDLFVEAGIRVIVGSGMTISKVEGVVMVKHGLRDMGYVDDIGDDRWGSFPASL